jgi:hypothetical protein
VATEPKQEKRVKIRLSEAARLLECHEATLRKRIEAGEFTKLRSLGEGRGKPYYVYLDEIEAAMRGEQPAKTSAETESGE